MLFVVLASFHETIPKQYVYSIVILGFAIVLTVIVGQALSLAGFNIPQVKGKARQVWAAGTGIVLIVVGVWILRDQAWSDQLRAIEAEIEAKSAPQPQIEFDLDQLAVNADHSSFRNQSLCHFIELYNEPLPPEIKERIATRRVDLVFECYTKITNSAVANLNNRQTQQLAQSTAAASAQAPTKSEVKAVTQNADKNVEIAKAATSAGQEGWFYLGRPAADGDLSDRTIYEHFPNVGQVVSTITDVKLHDPNANTGSAPLRASPIVGIISRDSQAKIEQLQTTPRGFLWAKATLVHNGDTGQVAGTNGFQPQFLCPQRMDAPNPMRSNDQLWIVAGVKKQDSDLLESDGNIDARCLPRTGETVTLAKATPVYKGWDPLDSHVPGHDPLSLTGQTLPAGTRVQVVTGLGALPKADGFEVYLPVRVATVANAPAASTRNKQR
jgi:hypothetical protein